MTFLSLNWMIVIISLVTINPASAETTPSPTEAPNGNAPVRYVSDQILIQLRAGPGNNYKILRSIASGAALELLASEDQYSRVKITDGTEGWVLNQYLQDSPIYKQQFIKAKDQISILEKQIALLKKEQETLQLTNKNLSNAKTGWDNEKKILLQETEHLRNVAAKPLALSDENEVLSKKTQSQEEKLNALIDQMQQLRDESNKQWFLTGAGVVLAGMLIGILIPRLRRHRQSDWAATLR